MLGRLALARIYGAKCAAAQRKLCKLKREGLKFFGDYGKSCARPGDRPGRIEDFPMVNSFVHSVETLEHETVETVGALVAAVQSFRGTGWYELLLDETYVVELIAETLTDGSSAMSVRIRKALPINQPELAGRRSKGV